MNIRRISGIVIIISGLSLYVFSTYIADQVSAGREKITKGEKNVNQLRDLTSLSPYTKGFGGLIADSGQKKIDAGKEEASEYEQLAHKLYLGGIALVILGAGLFGISFVHKNKSS